MWRRHGDSLYALLVVAVFTLELGALAALVWVSSLRLGGLIPRSRLDVVVVGAGHAGCARCGSAQLH